MHDLHATDAERSARAATPDPSLQAAAPGGLFPPANTRNDDADQHPREQHSGADHAPVLATAVGQSRDLRIPVFDFPAQIDDLLVELAVLLEQLQSLSSVRQPPLELAVALRQFLYLGLRALQFAALLVQPP